MNEKYLIGAAIGFGLAYVMLSSRNNAQPQQTMPPVPPIRLPNSIPAAHVGVRPWTTAWGNVRPMIAQRHYYRY